MVILKKQEFNTLVSIYKGIINEHGNSITTSGLRETVAQSFGFKSANGLLSAIPCKLDFENSKQQLLNLLKVKNSISIDDSTKFFHKINYQYYLKLLKKPLKNQVVSVDYTYLKNFGDDPLVMKGIEPLKEGVPFLFFLPEQGVVFPQVILDVTQLSHISGDLSPRFRLPADISFEKLHDFLNTDDVLEKFVRITNGLEVIAEGNSLRKGILDEDAHAAKEEIIRLIDRRLGEVNNQVSLMY